MISIFAEALTSAHSLASMNTSIHLWIKPSCEPSTLALKPPAYYSTEEKTSPMANLDVCNLLCSQAHVYATEPSQASPFVICPTNYTPLMFPQVPVPVATVFPWMESGGTKSIPPFHPSFEPTEKWDLKIADEGVFKIDLIWENVAGICEKVGSRIPSLRHRQT